MEILKSWDGLFEEDKLQWLIRIRKYVLFIQYPLSLVGLYFGYLNHGTLWIFLTLNTIFLLYNFFLARRKKEHSLLRQMVLDVFVFTVLLTLSGGPSNPFYIFFHIFAVLGGLFAVKGRGPFFLIFLLASLLWTHLYFNYTHPNVHLFIDLVVQLLVSSIIFFLSRSLGQHLHFHQNHNMQLALQNARLDRLRALGSLSAGLSHEFSSPLNTIKLRLNRLKKHHPELEQDEDWIESQLATLECEAVLRKMNSSQIDHRALEVVTFKAEKTLKQIIQKWKEINPEAKVELKIQDSLIHAPILNFAQSVLNLLDNALESGSHHIKVSLSENADEVTLSVEDQGSGFTPEVLKHLGEPFNTSKPQGTGLGLYSVFLFMDSIAGRYEVKNKEDKSGAQINLYFPKVSYEENPLS